MLFDVENIVTLKSELGVTHAANLWTICTSLKSTDPGYLFPMLYGSILIHFYTVDHGKAI